MDVAEIVMKYATSRQKGIEELIRRGDSVVQQFYEGATVFVTGGSGFLGKQLIEKLLRTCRINKVYMLMRPKRGKNVKERIIEIFEDALYDTLREEQPNFTKKIIPIIGDVADVDIGISDTDRSILIQEVDVIFHVAASISFQEPLRSATFTNVRGTRELLKLAHECKKIRCFVYMSTAYSHATYSRRNTEIFEQTYPTPLTPQLMIRLAEILDDDKLNGMTDAIIKDWPNTYAFTKALAEDLIVTSAGDLPVRIIRPSVVICARREPYAGWIDKSSVIGPNGMTVGCMLGVIHALHTTQDIRVDFIPVDYVTNAAIVAAQTNIKGVQVYTVASSFRNHITWGGLTHILNTVAKRTVVSPKAMWYCFAVQSPYKCVYNVFSFLLHDIPANLIDGVCVILRKPPRLKKIYAMITKMGAIVSFYTNNSWVFNDKNTQELYENLTFADKNIYHCDISDVEWTEHILLWCVGIRKFIVKDGLKNTDTAMKKQFYFKMATYFLTALFVFLIVWILFLFFKFCLNF